MHQTNPNQKKEHRMSTLIEEDLSNYEYQAEQFAPQHSEYIKNGDNRDVITSIAKSLQTAKSLGLPQDKFWDLFFTKGNLRTRTMHIEGMQKVIGYHGYRAVPFKNNAEAVYDCSIYLGDKSPAVAIIKLPFSCLTDDEVDNIEKQRTRIGLSKEEYMEYALVKTACEVFFSGCFKPAPSFNTCASILSEIHKVSKDRRSHSDYIPLAEQIYSEGVYSHRYADTLYYSRLNSIKEIPAKESYKAHIKKVCINQLTWSLKLADDLGLPAHLFFDLTRRQPDPENILSRINLSSLMRMIKHKNIPISVDIITRNSFKVSYTTNDGVKRSISRALKHTPIDSSRMTLMKGNDNLFRAELMALKDVIVELLTQHYSNYFKS